MKIIEIENLSFKYDEDQVLNNVSFAIEEGEWVSILGHNGSGKSTLSRILIGLLSDFEGNVKINGNKLSEETIEKIREDITIVFQNPDNQFVGSTVKDDIAFGLENRQIPREEMLKLVEKYANLVKMGDYLESEPHNLSGGQRQRVAIAASLALNSKILILDEATSMLDPEGAKDVMNLVKELKGTDKTIISITHNLEEARLSDRIILLDQGNLTFNGSVEELFKHEDLLTHAGLDILESMKVLNLVENSKLKDKKELKEVLCKLSLRM